MNRQIDHKTMRLIIGVIAILVAPIAYLAAGIQLDIYPDRQLTSISISYWTDSHDIFVGSLIAVGFFLSVYNGTGNGRDYEYLLSKIACLFAVCTAIFPTAGFNNQTDLPAKWISSLTHMFGITPEHVHFGSAILLFLCLILMMFFFSVRAKAKGKLIRAKFYILVSFLMVVGMLTLHIIGEVYNWKTALFWVETWGLSLFGIGWLAAGSYKTEHAQ